MKLTLTVMAATAAEVAEILKCFGAKEAKVNFHIDPNTIDKQMIKCKQTSPLAITTCFAIIVKEVADYFQITTDDIRGKRGKGYISDARHIACYFMYNYTIASQGMIGEYLGNRDHTTVLNSMRQFENFCKTESGFKANVDEIERTLIDKLQINRPQQS